MKNKILVLLLSCILMLNISCATFQVYERKQVQVGTVPVYSTMQVSYDEPVYETKQVPYEYSYQETKSVPYTVKEAVPKQVELDPYITESKTFAILRFDGASQEVIGQSIAGFRLGFLSEARNIKYPKNPTRTVDFVLRVNLAGVLTESQLNDLGPTVYKAMSDKFGVNYILTATILSSNAYRMEIQITDMEGNPILSGPDGVFSGTSWEDIGKQAARLFLSTRYETQIVQEEVIKYRTESITKTETRYKTERVQIGMETKYKTEQYKSGEEKTYESKYVNVGTEQKFSPGLLFTDLLMGFLAGGVTFAFVGTGDEIDSTTGVGLSAIVGIGSTIACQYILGPYWGSAVNKIYR